MNVANNYNGQKEKCLEYKPDPTFRKVRSTIYVSWAAHLVSALLARDAGEGFRYKVWLARSMKFVILGPVFGAGLLLAFSFRCAHVT